MLFDVVFSTLIQQAAVQSGVKTLIMLVPLYKGPSLPAQRSLQARQKRHPPPFTEEAYKSGDFPKSKMDRCSESG